MFSHSKFKGGLLKPLYMLFTSTYIVLTFLAIDNVNLNTQAESNEQPLLFKLMTYFGRMLKRSCHLSLLTLVYIFKAINREKTRYFSGQRFICVSAWCLCVYFPKNNMMLAPNRGLDREFSKNIIGSYCLCFINSNFLQ